MKTIELIENINKVSGNPQACSSVLISDLMKEASRQLDSLNKTVSREVNQERDAARWNKLLRLTGHVQDGSDTVVKIFQDDATRTHFIKVGDKSYFGAGFGAVIDQIPE